jgi:predicted ATPase
LGVSVTDDRPAVKSAKAHLRQREVLLIIDNCENLVSASASLAETLLQTCLSVSILVTSPQGLSVAGERLYRVPSLAFPRQSESIIASAANACSAVQLFVNRAAAITEGFALDNANAPGIASICSQVEGIPLAIELAVGRLRMMRPDWLAANLSASFRTLRRSTGVGPRHHQTLRNMLDWSCDLLLPEEQTLLRRLAVFAGGCSLASAIRVAGGRPITEEDVFDLLSPLLEKSLFAVDYPQPSRGTGSLKQLEDTHWTSSESAGEPGQHTQLVQYLLDRFNEAGES